MMALSNIFYSMSTSTKQTGPTNVSRNPVRTQSVLERMEDSLGAISSVLSDCEKIKCTPLPLSYSRHSSRFFTLFSFTLPFSLVQDTTPLLIAPVVVGMSWVLFATDEIGHVIEEPFGSGLQQEQVCCVYI